MRFCLVVPNGEFDPDALVSAIRRHHPDAEIGAAWGGDPHRRPPLPPEVVWLDLDLPEPTGAGWGRLLVALGAESYEWVRAARAVSRWIDESARGVAVLRLGSVGVCGSLADLVPSSGLAVVEQAPGPLPADGLAPTEGAAASAGDFSLAAIGFAADAGAVADAIASSVAASGPDDVLGPLVALTIRRAATTVTAVEGAVVAGWHPTPLGAPPPLVVVDDVDPAEPWHLAFDGRRPRVLLADDPELAAAIDATVSHWSGARRPVSLPGGIEIDDPIRTLVHATLDAWRVGAGDLPPEPFGADGLLPWLETPAPSTGTDIGRYWFEEWRRRPDLHVIFPRPADDDRERFVEWARTSWKSDRRSPLIRAGTERLRPEWNDTSRTPGVNLIGYIASDLGLGDFTRRIHRALELADVPVAALHYHRSLSPLADDVPPLTTDLVHDTNLVTVHADQMRLFESDYGSLVTRDRRTIGYWFWELAHVPPRIAAAAEHVDEVWAATEFVADGFRAVTDRPVRVVPVPVPEPTSSGKPRSELGLPADRFVFLVTFDHLSITERKHPLGAIEAFTRAFPTASDDGPVLVIKTLNAAQRWSQHERIRLAAANRPDVVVVDRHVSRADQMALIGASDCLVSLHRSEGLGLHLMEAMWLGVPVLATRYSGNVDFMDDTNSALVDADLIPVVDTEGYYPGDAVWADPDLDQAAAWMRRLVDEPATSASLAAAGRRTMMEQPSLAETGALIASLSRSTRQNEENR